MFNIATLLILSVILVIGTIFIYVIYYTYKINKKIQSENFTGRRLMDVSKVVVIAVITGLVIFSGILMYIANDYSIRYSTMDHSISRNAYAIIDTSKKDAYEYISTSGSIELNDASFAKVYSKDENPGYDREVVKSGDYKFIVFTRNTESDVFHPDFLCFVDYNGTQKKEYTCYETESFQSLESKESDFGAGSAGDIRSDILYIGNLDKGCQFNISLSLLDADAETKYDEALQQAYSEDKGLFPKAEGFACSVGKVSIVIE